METPAKLIQAYGEIPLNQLVQDLQNQAKMKEIEISKQMKSLIKDSLRISYKEMGRIYYNAGELHSACQCWVKSLDLATLQEDIFNMNLQLALTAFHQTHDYRIAKFSQDAISKDNF
mmetsp:Transcript_16056/g.27077  ORF Transcript_16056/g.27077 Transcript_16056/m.27077 type:complete len:117 (-) Transcript_16056:758-1108(-)